MMMVITKRMPLERMLNRTEKAVPRLYDSDRIDRSKFMGHKLHELLRLKPFCGFSELYA